MKVTGPGLGLITFADEDLGNVDPTWYCRKGDLVVDTARALRTIEEELYKVLVKVADVIPPLPKP